MPVVTVLPLTKLQGKQRKPYAFEVILPARFCEPDGVESIVMPQQIRSISKDRLIEKKCTIRDVHLRDEIENAVLTHLGIEFEE